MVSSSSKDEANAPIEKFFGPPVVEKNCNYREAKKTKNYLFATVSHLALPISCLLY